MPAAASQPIYLLLLRQAGPCCRYVEFLEGLADTHNTRALFERALAETPPEASQPLWDRYIQVSASLGDVGHGDIEIFVDNAKSH